ncbi:unnamed protein product [Clonostachys rosea]|uniref:Ankyrin n=1 Tax=Bionectria ochroleuca TaxID=29856 RepID=A0ABY6UMV5_BIOOC|nr:unnamed protein product [Clonostachys rosea]
MLTESNLHILSTRLLAACKQGSLSTVRSIVPTLYPASSPPSLSALIPPLKIALATAARHGQADVLRYLLTSPQCSASHQPWSPSFKDPPGSLPEEWNMAAYSDLVVIRAISSSSTSVVQALLDAGMPVDYNMEKIGAPLVHAITLQSLEMVKFLLEKGANVNGMLWIPCWSFLAHAATFPSIDILNELLSHEAKLPGSIALRAAAQAGNIKMAEVLLEKGADVNELDRWNMTDQPDDFIGTPLHGAVIDEQGEMVKFLLSRGARTDLRDGEGKTARDIAEIGDRAEMQKILDEAK